MMMDRNQENTFWCMANMLTQTLPRKEVLKLAIYFDSFGKVFLSMYNNQKNVLSHWLPHLNFCKGTEIFFRNETLHIKLTNDKRLFTASVCEFRWWLDRSQTWPPLLGVPIPNFSRASSYLLRRDYRNTSGTKDCSWRVFYHCKAKHQTNCCTSCSQMERNTCKGMLILNITHSVQNTKFS